VQADRLDEFERAVVHALLKIRDLSAEGALPPVLDALNLIAPPHGFRVNVELKPYTDHARDDQWSRQPRWEPGNGEIHITFEPAREDGRRTFEPARDDGRRADRDFPQRESREMREPRDVNQGPVPGSAPPDAQHAARDIVGVVARAENDSSFKFLALKFLRDQLLPRNAMWARDPQEAQIQINRAIDAGVLVTGKVENPRMPAYPVTTVALNRENAGVQQLLAEMAGPHAAAPSNEPDSEPS